MQAIFSLATSATGTVIATAHAIGLSKNATTSLVTKRIWLDPISTMVALAILRFKPEGTKINFDDRHIGYNPPGLLQGPTRQFVNFSSSNDLYNLVTAIFYANLWLKPFINKEHNILFKMAQIAIDTLIKKTYKDDPAIQLTLTTAHKRLLAKILKGKCININDFLIPELSDHPVTQACRKYWLEEDGSPLKVIVKRLHELQTKFDPTKEAEQELNEILQMLAPAHRLAQSIFQNLETGS